MSDIPVRLRPRAVVPSGWPPDVLPNQLITAAHINAIRSSVYAWPGDVDGQGHTLSNVHLAGVTGVLADPTTTAGDLIARDGSAIGRFPIGSAGQVLTVDLAAPAKLRWATPANSPVLSVFGRLGAVVAQAGDYTAAQVTGAVVDNLTTKGDIFARGAAATGRFPAGADGQVLRADASQPFGLRWAGESVPSVFGRTGPIVAQAGDYDAAKVTNAVSVLGAYPDPAWLTSLSWAKVIGAPASFPPAAHTHDAAAIVSGVLATARLGTGVADASVYLRGDGTWAAAGTGGGGGVVSVFGRAGTVIATAGDYTAAQVTGAVVNPTSIKGDLMVRNDLNSIVRLPVGASGQVLQADSSLTVGMKWTNISAAVQTPWVTDVDAANFQLINVRRLGVALALPAYPLDVTGDINFTGTLRQNGLPVSFGGSQTPWTSNINAAGFTLFSAGQIGVGTPSPQAAAHLVSAGNVTLLLESGAGSAPFVAYKRGAQTWWAGPGMLSDASWNLYDQTGGKAVFTATPAGNIGIGLGPTAPSCRFHMAGPSAASDVSTAHQFHLGVDSNITYGLQMGYYSTASSGIASVLQNWQGAPGGCILLQPSGGNVGIGTQAPLSALHITRIAGAAVGPVITLENSTGQLRDAASIKFVDAALRSELRFSVESAPYGGDMIYFGGSDGTSEVFRATSGGAFSIGAGATPGARLHLYAPTGVAAVARLQAASSTDTVALELMGASANCFWSIITNRADALGAGDTIGFYKNSGSPGAKLVVTGAGRVGINGVVSPAYALDVAGDVNITGAFRVNGAALTFDAAAIVSGVLATARLGTGTPNSSVFLRGDGTWASAGSGGPSTFTSGGKVIGTVYQNQTNKPIWVSVLVSFSSNNSQVAQCDTANPPTTQVASVTTTSGIQTLSFIVLPNYFYKMLAAANVTLVSWFEWT